MGARLELVSGSTKAIRHTGSVIYQVASGHGWSEIGDQRFRRKPTGLGGDPPDPQKIPSGCSFHPRCPVAFDECPTREPEL